MSSVKTALKAARDAINAKDWLHAKDNALRVLELDSANYNAYVFLGLATQHAEQPDESEAAYKKAVEINDTLPLAWQGLCSLYEKKDELEPLLLVYEKLRSLSSASNDGKKVLEYTNKLIHTSTRLKKPVELVQAWLTFTPDSPIYLSISEIEGVPTPLLAWREIAKIQEADDAETIRKEIETRRRRLNAETLSVVTAKVVNEVLSKSKLDSTYEHIMELIANEDEEFADMQGKYLELLRRKLLVATPAQKAELRKKLLKFAQGIVTDGRPVSAAYEIVIEAMDVDEPAKYDELILERYIEFAADTPFGRILKGHLLWQRGESLETALEFYSAGFDDLPTSVFGHHSLCWLYHNASDFGPALDYAQKCEELIAQYVKATGQELPRTSSSIALCIANCYSQLDPNYYGNALTIYKSLLDGVADHGKVLEGIGRIYISQKKYTEAKSVFTKLLEMDPLSHTAKSQIGWIKFAEEDFDDALKYLHKALEECSETSTEAAALYHYRLGRVYWSMGDNTQSFSQLIAAAKANPKFGDAFTYLGHYYRCHAKDHVRAKKCYIKAFSLNPADAEAGIELSEYFIRNNENRSAEELLRTVTTANLKAGWAWKRLGFVELRKHEYVEAINCFQTALRTNVKDVKCWEALAEAYRYEGRYMAAMKAFVRATELDPTSFFATYQIANVQKILGMYIEAIEQYGLALDMLAKSGQDDNTRVLPILDGLGAAHIAFSQEYISSGHYGRAADHASKALRVLRRAIDLDARPICLWKAVGDALLIFQLIPAYVGAAPIDPIFHLAKLSSQDDPNGKLLVMPNQEREALERLEMLSTMDNAQLDIEEVLAAASVVFKHVLLHSLSKRALPSTSSAVLENVTGSHWFDLSLTYYYRYRASLRNKGNLAGLSSYLVTATRCIKAAITLEPANHVFWNALGICTITDAPILSQHSFIKAIEYGPKSAVPWANLGFLYLTLSDLELANQAFATSQTLDPEFPLAWIGQAYIAGIWQSSHAAQPKGNREASHLWTHAWELSLGNVLEVNLNYALCAYTHAVTEQHHSGSKSSVDGESELVTPAFALEKLLEQRPDDMEALNLLGLILERQGQHGRAAETFMRAYTALSSTSPDADKSQQDDVNKRASIILANLGRARCASEDYEGAVEAYTLALSMNPGVEDTKVHLGAGLACYFAGKLEDSLQEFELALAFADQLQPLPNDAGVPKPAEAKHEVVMLLCAVLWALGTDDARAMAKQQLFQCISENPQFVHAIFALTAMGMLQNDDTLITAALEELLKLPTDVADLYDPSKYAELLISRYFLLQKDHKNAKAFLSRAVHLRPELASTWIRLSQFLTIEYPERSLAAASAGMSASATLRSHGAGALKGELCSSTVATNQAYNAVAIALLGVGAVDLRAVDGTQGIEDRRIEAGNLSLKRAKAAAARSVLAFPGKLESWALLAECCVAERTVQDWWTPKTAENSIKEKDVATEILDHVYSVVVSRLATSSTAADTLSRHAIGRLRDLGFWTVLSRAHHSPGGGAEGYRVVEELVASNGDGLGRGARRLAMLTMARCMWKEDDAESSIDLYKQCISDCEGDADADQVAAFCWQELARVYFQRQCPGASSLCLQTLLQNNKGRFYRNPSLRLPHLLRLSHLSLLAGDEQAALETLTEVFTVLAKIDSRSSGLHEANHIVAKLMQGIAFWKSGNVKRGLKTLENLVPGPEEQKKEKTSEELSGKNSADAAWDEGTGKNTDETKELPARQQLPLPLTTPFLGCYLSKMCQDSKDEVKAREWREREVVPEMFVGA